MKFAIVFAALFALAVAAPAKPASGSDAQILSDGTAINAQGQLKRVDPENAAIVQSGSFRFVADDGQTYEINYIADENGFQPQGAHLPVAPEA
uniref:Uncharacterized protein n=1 Tax=Megaselia scalaris TaxID=36166 RepID=T1GJJ8_MEGSC